MKSNSKGWVGADGDSGVGGVLGPVGDISDRVAVDANASNGAVDLEAGLEVKDGAVVGKAHNDHRGRGRRPR